MHSGMIGVWDKDPAYAEALCEYLRRQDGLGALVVMYTDPERLQQAISTRQVSLLLADSSKQQLPWLQDVPVLFLTEQKEEETDVLESVDSHGMPRACAYKYQPVRRWGLYLDTLREQGMLRQPASPRRKRTSMARVRGIYSPMGGCLKTSLGLVMGSILAEEKRCLFLCLEAHGGFRTLFGRQYPVDLADLLAAIRQDGPWQQLLGEAMQPFGKLQYIPPVIWPADIREAEEGELEKLIQCLALCGRFDEIIVDVGQDLCRPEKILTLCDRIYLPHKKDVFSQAKLSEYECYLQVGGYEALRQRTRKIDGSSWDLQRDGTIADQWQCWERMIPLVHQLLKEEEGDGHG